MDVVEDLDLHFNVNDSVHIVGRSRLTSHTPAERVLRHLSAAGRCLLWQADIVLDGEK